MKVMYRIAYIAEPNMRSGEISSLVSSKTRDFTKEVLQFSDHDIVQLKEAHAAKISIHDESFHHILAPVLASGWLANRPAEELNSLKVFINMSHQLSQHEGYIFPLFTLAVEKGGEDTYRPLVQMIPSTFYPKRF